MARMRAIRFHDYGGPEVLQYEEVEKPEAAEGEVLVRVHATSVNPLDWKIRAGLVKSFRPVPLPFILGWDVSGVVESVGPGVTGFKPGDEVYGRPDITKPGAYAEYIAVKETELAPKPKSLDHVTAAGVPLTALTAWQALFDYGGLTAWQTVLIHAAAGGVGSFAVQFAKHARARVVGTASGRNQDYLRELGVDFPINYETTKFEDIAKNVNVVIEPLGGEIRERSFLVIRPGGILVAITGPAPSEELAKRYNVRTVLMLVRADRAQLDRITDMIDKGQLKVPIEAVFPLAQAAKAHALSAQGHARGKIILQVV